MTVSNSTRTAGPYIGNGLAVEFPFGFKVFTANDVVVVTNRDGVETTLTLNTDYTISLGQAQDTQAGGTITLAIPPRLGDELVITSNIAELQNTALTNNGGFYPKVIEAALDRLTILIQQLRTVANRSLRFPLSDIGTDTQLPTAEMRANRLLGFDSTGRPTAYAPADQSASALAALLANNTGASLVNYQGTALSSLLKNSVPAVVRNIAELLLIDTAIFTKVQVLGYYAPGDGGGGLYFYDSTDTSSPSNGGTIIVGLNSVRWRLAEATRVSIAQFGARGDNTTNNFAAIQAAVNAVQGTSYKLIIPAGKFAKAGTIVITSPIWIEGDSQNKSIIRETGGTAGGFDVNYPSYKTGGGMCNFTIESGLGWESAGFQGQGAIGIGLRMTNVNGGFSVENLGINNFTTGLRIRSCWTNKFYALNILYFRDQGIYIDQTEGSGGFGGDNQFSQSYIVNNGFTGVKTGSTGIFIAATGGEQFTNVNVAASNVGIGLYAPTGKQVNYLWFIGCLVDTTMSNGIEVDGSTGTILSVEFTNCWSAFATTGSGLFVTGTGIKSIRWNGGRLRENGGSGCVIDTSGGVYIDAAEIASNSRGFPNVSSGVTVTASRSNWSLTNSRVGNFASASSNQAYAVASPAGTSSFVRILGNDLSANGLGPLNNAGTFVNSLITNNI